MYDNELYALTKSQTSPTTRIGHKTNTQPKGTYLDPLNPIRLVLGIGASFVAGTADWMPDHFTSTLNAAFAHKGFSFVHVLQRCPHFDPHNFQHKETTWFSFLKHEKGVPPDKRIADKTELVDHDPSNLEQAFKYANDKRKYFGLFYHDPDKPRYDDILIKQTRDAPKASLDTLFNNYRID